MREILFRGKRKYNGEWVQGDFNQWLKGSFILTDNTDSRAKTNIEVIPETVGQYTGLTDKNGKKIFEGDILRDVFMELNAKVVFYDSSFWLVYQTREGGESTPECEWADILDELQVIGNIHDNSELLKGGVDNG